MYRARDSKLNRDVAIKILPSLVAADPERRARFEREARALASLNHPNIAHIYGVISRRPTGDGPTTRAVLVQNWPALLDRR